MNFDLILRSIKFVSHFYQGMALFDSQLLQLPGIDRNNIDLILKKIKRTKIKDLLASEYELNKLK